MRALGRTQREAGDDGPRGVRAAAAVACAVALLAAGLTLGTSGDAGATTAKGAAPPNFLFILSDDQALNTFRARFMPQTFDTIVRPGTRFTNGFAAPPLCCPARATLLTGQYPHNHGVFSNHPGYADLINNDNTLATWLNQAGYRTALIGNFLNHYARAEGTTPAPGFDRWFELIDGHRYYDYSVSDDGVEEHFGIERKDYSTDVYTRKAKRFLRASATKTGPFFLWLAYNSPHAASGPDRIPCRNSAPTAPSAESVRRVRDIPLPKPAGFNEPDVSDKSAPIADQPRLKRRDVSRLEGRWHCTLAAMAQQDRQTGRLMEVLRRTGELRRTIVIYLSDNGVFFGEHRLRNGKSWPYEPALRIPYAIRVPGAYRDGSQPGTVNKLVANEDIVPTILGYVEQSGLPIDTCDGQGHCRRLDGRSLQPLLRSPSALPWTSGRGILAELDEPGFGCRCTYSAIRTSRYLYFELNTGEQELYDLSRDPAELLNRAGRPKYAGAQATLALRLASLRACTGIEGREPPDPPRPFCE